MAWNRLRIARTTEALRIATTYLDGELIKPTDGADDNRLFIGDGSTVGGLPIAFKSEANTGLRGSISGLVVSNNASDANNDLDISPGAARDSTSTYDLILASGITKRLDAAWAVGTGNGGLDTGSKAATTGYHVYLIRRTSDGVIDVLLSTSATSPTLPSGWVAKRRIGSVMTNGSSNIRAFKQAGGWFSYRDGAAAEAGPIALATPVLQTISVPSGIKYEVSMLAITAHASSTPGWVVVSDPDLGVPSNGANYGVFYRRAAIEGFVLRCFTDSSRHIYVYDDVADADIYINTRSYFDHRDEYL